MIKGYLAPELTYFNKNEQPHLLPVNSELISNWEAEFANHKTDFKVLLFRGNPQELQQFEDSSMFDRLLPSSERSSELIVKVPSVPSFSLEFSLFDSS